MLLYKYYISLSEAAKAYFTSIAGLERRNQVGNIKKCPTKEKEQDYEGELLNSHCIGGNSSPRQPGWLVIFNLTGG